VPTTPDRDTGSVRGSPAARRLGSVVLGIILALNLGLITYSLADQLFSLRKAALLAGLWLLSAFVFVYLFRGWHRAKSRD